MTTDPAVSLADYDRHKSALADVLRVVAPLRRRKPSERDEEVQQLFARIAEDRFNLVVVGRFSRGKSSLMNAIIGADWLPTGIAPLTSVITAVSYGSHAGVELTFRDRGWRQRVELSELATFVTQDANPGNIKRVRIADIQLPAEILRRGFHFIDTPGLGSPIEENSETTEAFLPQADAFLLVTSFDGPLSGEEDRFLKDASATGKRIFVAVNKQDTVSVETRSQVLDYVHQRLASVVPCEPPHVFSTSATDGLAAKLAEDAQRLTSSGVAALEDALIDFLVAQKSRDFLLNLASRIEAVIRSLPEAGVRTELTGRLETVRRPIGGPASAAVPAAAVARAGAERAVSCEVCGAIQAATFDHLRSFQYDLTVSEAARAALVRDGGLCPLHTWWYAALASPHGTCIAFPPLLEAWSATLLQFADSQQGGADVSAGIRDRAGRSAICPTCRACREAEQNRLRSLAADLGQNDRAPSEVSAICITHLAAVVELIESPGARRRLLMRQAGLFGRFAEDMRGYAVKFDGLRRALLSDSEHDAAARGLRLLAGLANVSFTRKPD